MSSLETPRHRPRALLTEQQAVEIYKYRRATDHSQSDSYYSHLVGKSSDVAVKYNISPKAVRDIWNRRTWIQETRHLWAADEIPRLRRNITKSSKLSRRDRCGQLIGRSFRHCSSPSPSLKVLYTGTWAAHSNSCGIFTADGQAINPFRMQQAFPQPMHFLKLGTPSTMREGPGAEISTQASQPLAAGMQAATRSAASRGACSGAWDAEWGEGPLSGGAPDPFSSDWPHW